MEGRQHRTWSRKSWIQSFCGFNIGSSIVTFKPWTSRQEVDSSIYRRAFIPDPSEVQQGRGHSEPRGSHHPACRGSSQKGSAATLLPRKIPGSFLHQSGCFQSDHRLKQLCQQRCLLAWKVPGWPLSRSREIKDVLQPSFRFLEPSFRHSGAQF